MEDFQVLHLLWLVVHVGLSSCFMYLCIGMGKACAWVSSGGMLLACGSPKSI